MTSGAHVIGTQRLHVSVASEEVGRALMSRLDDLQRTRIAPVLERVLDELSVAGWQIELGRIAVDLGTIPLSRFEEILAERLRRELLRAVGDAVRAARDNPSPEGRAWTESAARARLLEHYLLRGTLPSWASDASPSFSFEERLVEQIREDPVELARMLRRHRGRSEVLERLALQLGGAALAQLLGALAPEQAALILAYLIDLREIHRREPLVTLAEDALGRLAWVLVLHYLLRDPGSQFNRRSFVLWLLEGLAMSEGVLFEDLLETLRRALLEAERHHPLGSSLPAVIREILVEYDNSYSYRWPMEAPEGEEAAASGGRGLWGALEHHLSYGTAPAWAGAWAGSLEGLFLAVLERDPARVDRLVRSVGEAPTTLERIVLALDTAALARLLRALTPENAALILAILADLGEAHRAHRVASMSDEDFGQRLWVLTLTYVVREPNTQFNRRTFVRSLLERMAASEGAPYAELLAALRAGIEKAARARRLDSSLPVVLQEIVTEGERLGPSAAALGALSHDAAGAWDMLASYLSFGAVHPSRRGAVGDWLGGLLLSALERDRARVSALIRRYGRDDAALERMVLDLGDPSLDRVLAALEPEGAAPILAVLADLRETHRTRALLPLTEEVFGRRLWILTLGYVVRDPGTQHNRKTFLRSLLVRMAESEALDYAQLLSTVRLALEETERRRPLESSLASALRELLDEEERAGSTRREPWSIAAEGASLPGGLSPEELSIDVLKTLLDGPGEELSAFVARQLRSETARAHWARALPEAALARVVAALAPSRSRDLLLAAEILSSAWSAAAPDGEHPLGDRASFWSLVLAILTESPGAEPTIERLTTSLFERFAAWSRGRVRQARGGPAPEERFVEHARRLAADAGHAALTAALPRAASAALPGVTSASPARVTGATGKLSSPPRGAPTAAERPRALPRSAPLRGKMAFRLGGAEVPDDAGAEVMFVDNAGLVLTGPFLPHLFGRLDMLGRDPEGKPRLRDAETASRAAHLLEYLVTGRTSTPEAALVLNKVLCGIPLGAPVAAGIDITEPERETCEQLLRAMIAHWEIIRNTSIAGLRETFLRRAGKLTRAEDRWLLRVDRKTVDVLVDQIPWSLSVVFHAWMPLPLHVTW